MSTLGRRSRRHRALQLIRRGLQETSDNGDSLFQTKMEQELNHCLLMND